MVVRYFTWKLELVSNILWVIVGLNQDPSHSERSALTHFSMSLVRKYVNLKQPYIQDSKE